MEKDWDCKIRELRAGVLLYAPVFMYLLLKNLKTKDEIGDLVQKISGRSVKDWPKENYQEFERLFSSEEKWLFAQKEIIYFLIFVFSGYTFKYIHIQDQDKMREVLDSLFDVFNNDSMPWFRSPPEENSYTKYQRSENPLLEFQKEISRISGEKDSLKLFDFIAEITGISKFFIKPSVDKLFS